MSKNNFFAMISRMKYINRWSLMRNTVTENLSEHSLEVAFIAHLLCLIRNKRFGGNVNAERAAVIAMYHDTTEIITGDLPTPVKYYNKDIREIYGDIEKNAADKLVSQLPDDLKDEYEEIISGGDDDEIKSLVKAADKISALIKCIEERQMGNKDFLQAEQSTLRSIKAMNIKEADVFLEEFVEGYGLTLDELTEQ
ncbi:MAG: 5'-deoxynucleotidase [Ruminococcus sp.]|nr:5'-deoxynucleotidase [Ruminococcus sp.]